MQRRRAGHPSEQAVPAAVCRLAPGPATLPDPLRDKDALVAHSNAQRLSKLAWRVSTRANGAECIAVCAVDRDPLVAHIADVEQRDRATRTTTVRWTIDGDIRRAQELAGAKAE